MFDKLQKMFDSPPEREFKPRVQGLRAKPNPSQSTQDSMAESAEPKSEGRSVLIGEDPFRGKLDGERDQRIQSKLELLKRLQKELGE